MASHQQAHKMSWEDPAQEEDAIGEIKGEKEATGAGGGAREEKSDGAMVAWGEAQWDNERKVKEWLEAAASAHEKEKEKEMEEKMEEKKEKKVRKRAMEAGEEGMGGAKKKMVVGAGGGARKEKRDGAKAAWGGAQRENEKNVKEREGGGVQKKKEEEEEKKEKKVRKRAMEAGEKGMGGASKKADVIVEEEWVWSIDQIEKVFGPETAQRLSSLLSDEVVQARATGRCVVVRATTTTEDDDGASVPGQHATSHLDIIVGPASAPCAARICVHATGSETRVTLERDIGSWPSAAAAKALAERMHALRHHADASARPRLTLVRAAAALAVAQKEQEEEEERVELQQLEQAVLPLADWSLPLAASTPIPSPAMQQSAFVVPPVEEWGVPLGMSTPTKETRKERPVPAWFAPACTSTPNRAKLQPARRLTTKHRRSSIIVAPSSPSSEVSSVFDEDSLHFLDGCHSSLASAPAPVDPFDFLEDEEETTPLSDQQPAQQLQQPQPTTRPSLRRPRSESSWDEDEEWWRSVFAKRNKVAETPKEEQVKDAAKTAHASKVVQQPAGSAPSLGPRPAPQPQPHDLAAETRKTADALGLFEYGGRRLSRKLWTTGKAESDLDTAWRGMAIQLGQRRAAIEKGAKMALPKLKRAVAGSRAHARALMAFNDSSAAITARHTEMLELAQSFAFEVEREARTRGRASFTEALKAIYADFKKAAAKRLQATRAWHKQCDELPAC